MSMTGSWFNKVTQEFQICAEFFLLASSLISGNFINPKNNPYIKIEEKMRKSTFKSNPNLVSVIGNTGWQ